MGRTAYKNEHRTANSDRLELVLPLGWKNRLKEISAIMGISVNDYVCRLIKQDIENDHKHEDVITMLNRWEAKAKYHPMIDSASFTKGQGYYIKLKNGFISDYSGTNEIICKTTKELRHIMQLTHPVRSLEEMQGLDSKTYEQLLRWQVPKCYFKDIAVVERHSITFKDGRVWKFNSVNELRYMWKLSKEG